MNHKGLMYFAEGRDLSRRQIRYLNMLFEYNIKIIYRSRSQNLKVDALIRMVECKFIDFKNERLRQQHQIIFTSNRLDLDDIEFEINVIDDLFYHRVSEANKIDNECNNIRETIIDDKEKLRDITFNKCVITNEVLYYKDRLWVSESIYTTIIQETHDQPAYDHFEVARTYELFKREYY